MESTASHYAEKKKQKKTLNAWKSKYMYTLIDVRC